MTRSVAVVTDSTSYLPTELADELEIFKIPLEVIIDGKPFKEGVDIGGDEVADALRSKSNVTTSMPAPADFLSVYQKAAEAGYESIVSVHLSAKISGTYEGAVIASELSPIPVTPIDSRTIAMSMGYACVSGAQAANAGASNDEVASVIEKRATASSIYFYVDTLEYLKRGGRIGSLSAAIGTMLRVKPILFMNYGEVDLLEKTRTAGKALQRLADIALEQAGSEPVDFAVQHLGAPERAELLANLLQQGSPESSVMRSDVGAVVGTHVGPGMCAVSIAPRTYI